MAAFSSQTKVTTVQLLSILPERSLEIKDIAQSETISVQLHVSIK